MMKALAPRMPRGCSWVWRSFVLVGVLPVGLEAQTTKKATDAPKAETTAKDKDKDAAEKAKESDDAAPPEAEPKTPSAEVFKDLNAEKVLAKKFRALPGGPVAQPILRQVRDMAAGTANVNRETITKYVVGMAADLTNPRFLQALTDLQPGKPPGSSAGIRNASNALVEPLDLARKANNTEFLNIYNQELVKALAPVLENHLISRIEAMIALGQTGSRDAVDLCVKQLKDPNQTVWVKLWAARGITNVVQTPAGVLVDTALDAPKANAAAKALADFLNREKDAPWPAQVRALEAIGSLRLAASPTAQSKVEMAEAAARLLADPEARPEVRAEAAWALGMMRISPAARVNYPLIGYHVGEIAADLGEKVAAGYDSNMTQAQFWTGLLVYEVYPALTGQAGTRDSGLLNMPGLGGAKAALTQLGELVKPVVKSAVELVRSTPGQRPQLAKDLSERVGALRAYLDKNPPADRHLFPGGSEFPLKAQVAGGGGAAARVVSGGGAPGAR